MSNGQQVAALPFRRRKNGKIKVLLVTSRRRRRWVLPKGWPMEGKAPWEAAEIEALEEAGVRGRILSEAMGHFSYEKRLEEGGVLPCEVVIYPLVVDRVERRWKEKPQRQRRWFSPEEAARLVEEQGLADLLDQLQARPVRAPILKSLLKVA
ncbi:NUDIX domain-containing protein [Rhodovulum imhoffii]|uniref:NUDIX domain-containing protein n=1 Tax=Rhodovulum imhoffii TaxID=365340 RepID=A0A2T5BSG3_9RHOB|nr:NUDIX hydrolase [Rhodovulum imhoffii]PTN02285.1 NUDIX domain-containing protein [Rhodovulum imhoffii]